MGLENKEILHMEGISLFFGIVRPQFLVLP